MSSTKNNKTGIRSTKGTAGGVRGALWPLGHAAVGLASALAAGGALAQETTPPADAPRTEQPAPAPEKKQEGAQDTFVLPTVQVQEAAEQESYHAPESSLARVPAPLVNTPQSVTVVSREVLQEQQATSVRDALRNVSGITVAAGEGGRQGDSFNLRGFSAQTDTFRDGVRDLGWFTRDTFNLQGVEVYFGPSSVLFGRGSTGGALNLVTKKPGRRSFRNVSLSGGTAPMGRVEADINEAINDKIQVRLNALGQLSGIAGRDNVTENRAGIAPSARISLGESTALELDYLYQREDSTPDYGQPYYNGYPVSTSIGVPRGAFYGVKGVDTERVNAHIGTAQLQHRFSDSLQLTNSLRLGGVDRYSLPTAPRGLTLTAGSPTTIGRQRFETNTDNVYVANQLNVRGDLQTGFLKHQANAGLELTWETRELSRNNFNAVPGPNITADLFEPNPSPDLSTVNRVFASANQSRQWTVGVYAADQIAISRYVEVLGSARFDVFDTNYVAEDATRTRTELNRQDNIFNWRVGLLVHPLEKMSIYATYGTSANPSAEVGTLTTGTVDLAPERNNTIELGAKADLFEDRLGLTAAVFRVDKTNARVPNTDPSGPPTILDGAQRVQGFSVGVTGTITSNWRVIANYTQLDSEILKHSSAYLVGQPLPSTPPRSMSLWTTVTPLQHLTIGAGAVYQDVTTANNPASESVAFLKVPNFWRFDAFASYQLFNRVDLQLNLNNISDELYYEQYYAGQAVPGEARSANLTARVRF
ncbi:TonB-dependent receptor [Archangium sp. Cb G35]|uniref:TonB-dependent receptor n=1 Tax=Archangium sp. Cb G35 TaxID=1920190 RepID=UPI00093781FB|nr:TonB-dependent siderophore receptor [Archangium sp. Cb G35]OJT19095.1 TonB-dependent receptor [Archangium sp. Cb G35]